MTSFHIVERVRGSADFRPFYSLWVSEPPTQLSGTHKVRGQGSQDYVGHFRGHFSRWCLLLLPTVPGPEAITCPCQITGTWKPASLCAAGEERHHNLSSSTAIHLNWATSFLRIRTLGIYQQFKKHWLHPKGQAEQTEKKLWRWIKKPSEIASKEEVLGKKESSGKYIRERSGTLTLGAQQACINHMEVNECHTEQHQRNEVLGAVRLVPSTWRKAQNTFKEKYSLGPHC